MEKGAGSRSDDNPERAGETTSVGEKWRKNLVRKRPLNILSAPLRVLRRRRKPLIKTFKREKTSDCSGNDNDQKRGKNHL